MEKAVKVYNEKKKVFIAVSEGIHDKNGKLIAEYGSDAAQAKDSFGHAQLGGVGAYLARLLKGKTGSKTRSVELSLLQRCAAHCASQTDIEESFMAGQAAVQNALQGVTDKMVGFERVTENGGYACRVKLFDLVAVANAEKKVPMDWINATGDGVNEKFAEYALPLIQGQTKLTMEDGLPRFVNLKKVRA